MFFGKWKLKYVIRQSNITKFYHIRMQYLDYNVKNIAFSFASRNVVIFASLNMLVVNQQSAVFNIFSKKLLQQFVNKFIVLLTLLHTRGSLERSNIDQNFSKNVLFFNLIMTP